MKHKCDGLPAPGAMLMYTLACAAVICCSGACCYYKKRMYFQYQKEEQLFQSEVSSYLSVDDDARLVHDFEPYVSNLRTRGVLGRELRLDWIEALQQAETRLGLPSLNYRIGAQAEYHPVVPVPVSGYRVYYSPMHIDMSLLHEADLHSFFIELDLRDTGMYSIASCNLYRLHNEISFERVQGNIRAECELVWFNIRKDDGSQLDLS